MEKIGKELKRYLDLLDYMDFMDLREIQYSLKLTTQEEIDKDTREKPYYFWQISYREEGMEFTEDPKD